MVSIVVNKKNKRAGSFALAPFAEQLKTTVSGQAQALAAADQQAVRKFAKTVVGKTKSRATKQTLLSTANIETATLAAQVLASELNAPLYKVDLHQLSDKYIGETEKNLTAFFNEAERQGAVLFFDEADALFGKRSAVNDSHDRYANSASSHLLQRIESYSGVAILRSNNQKPLDSELTRRLGKVLNLAALPE
ncbi:MAG: AAA family ATPase [Gammaproteobacteria bacterium]|nr:AAA family ATPase [Gammaproteobacteria bacterium]MBQ0839290.1 AAA family ATPase [Gammaproteobacteria bacterium]